MAESSSDCSLLNFTSSWCLDKIDIIMAPTEKLNEKVYRAIKQHTQGLGEGHDVCALILRILHPYALYSIIVLSCSWQGNILLRCVVLLAAHAYHCSSSTLRNKGNKLYYSLELAWYHQGCMLSSFSMYPLPEKLLFYFNYN